MTKTKRRIRKTSQTHTYDSDTKRIWEIVQETFWEETREAIIYE